MNKFTLSAMMVSILASGVHTLSLAAEVKGLTVFSSKTPAIAGEVNSNFDNLKSAVNDNHTRIGNQQAAIGNLETVTAAQDTDLKKLGATSQTHTTDLNGLKTSTGALGTDVTNLKAAVVNNGQSISDLTGKATIQGNAIGTLQTDVGAVKTSVSEHTTSLSGLNTAMTAQTTIDTRQSTEISGLKVTTGNLGTDVASLKTSVATHDTKLTNFQTEVGAIKTVVTDHSANILSLVPTLNAHSSLIGALDARVVAVETHGGNNQCPPDMVAVGPSCIDKYEASVWDTRDQGLIAKIRAGKASVGDLTNQRGISNDNYTVDCPDTGNGCTGIFAASVAGVQPSRYTTWFQALAACRNSGKRLPTNQEWQMAAFGTPDPADNKLAKCNVATLAPSPSGANSSCVSDVGAYDMVGNLWEWVADWMQGGTTPFAPTNFRNSELYGYDASFSVNPAVNQGTARTNMPSTVQRGGSYADAGSGPPGNIAGVFAISLNVAPSFSGALEGFRCAK